MWVPPTSLHSHYLRYKGRFVGYSGQCSSICTCLHLHCMLHKNNWNTLTKPIRNVAIKLLTVRVAAFFLNSTQTLPRKVSAAIPHVPQAWYRFFGLKNAASCILTANFWAFFSCANASKLSASGGRPPDQELSPLDPAGSFALDPRYRAALRARHVP